MCTWRRGTRTPSSGAQGQFQRELAPPLPVGGVRRRSEPPKEEMFCCPPAWGSEKDGISQGTASTTDPSDTETGTSSQMPRPKGVSFLHSSEMSRAGKPPGKSPHLLTQCLWTGKERPLSSFSLGMRRGSFGMLCNAAPPFLLPAPCLPVRYATSTKRCCPECKISLELHTSVCPPRGRGSGWLGP